jgi:hypothetical protein
MASAAFAQPATPPAKTQPAAVADAKPSLPPARLKILVLQGRDAIQDVSSRNITVPIIEVRDLNDQPVEGAQVIFTLPAGGPGGSFPGNAITYTTRTNVQGQASAPLMPNSTQGKWVIQVTASSADRFGQMSIPQTNGIAPLPVSETGKSKQKVGRSNKKWWLLAGAGAAAVVAVALVVSNNGGGSSSSTPSRPTIVVTPGSPGIGGPR